MFSRDFNFESELHSLSSFFTLKREEMEPFCILQIEMCTRFNNINNVYFASRQETDRGMKKTVDHQKRTKKGIQ